MRRSGMELRNRIYRSRRDRMLAGVAGGLAEYFDVDPYALIDHAFGVFCLGERPRCRNVLSGVLDCGERRLIVPAF